MPMTSAGAAVTKKDASQPNRFMTLDTSGAVMAEAIEVPMNMMELPKARRWVGIQFRTARLPTGNVVASLAPRRKRTAQRMTKTTALRRRKENPKQAGDQGGSGPYKRRDAKGHARTKAVAEGTSGNLKDGITNQESGKDLPHLDVREPKLGNH